MRKLTILTTTLLAGLLAASATVTPYGWYRQGEANALMSSPWFDSSGNNLNMDSSFENSAIYVGNSPAVTNVSVGGPLGPNKIYSTVSAFNHYVPNNNGGYYSCATDVPWHFYTNRNWVMECWVLPMANGVRNNGSDNACILNMAGQNFANSITNETVQFWLVASNDVAGTHQDGTCEIQCICVGPYSATVNPYSTNNSPWYLDENGLPWNYQLGTNVVIKTPTHNAWTHLAAVRDDNAIPAYQFYPGEKGTVTFYVNGVAIASTNASRVWQAKLMDSSVTPNNIPNYPAGGINFTNQRPSIGTDNQSQPNNIGGISGYTIPTGPGQPLGGSGNRQFNGFVDEVRFSSFAPNAFSLSDLLTRSVAGPGIVEQPQNVTVYSGTAASFQVIPAYDTANTFQWYQVISGNLTPITAAGVVTTNPQLILPPSAYSTGSQFVCQMQNGSGTVYTATNTVTIVANPSAITDYQNTIMNENGLISYFPASSDNVAGNVLTDVEGGNNGIISGNAAFDGSNARFPNGGQGITFNRDGAWSFPVINGGATNGDDVLIPNKPAYDFASGFGTVEAVVYVDPAIAREPFAINFPYQLYGFTWLCEADLHQNPSTSQGFSPQYNVNANYMFSVDAFGHLIYWAGVDPSQLNNCPLIWTVPGGTIGRSLHVAFVFDNYTNITCYVNGQSLGAKNPILPGTDTQSVLGVNTGLPLHIGNASFTVEPQNTQPSGSVSQGYIPGLFYGSVGQVALYSTNLSANRIALHYATLLNGSTTVPVSVVNNTPSKSMFANGSETFSATASGTPPYSYQWYTNITSGGGPIPGATNYTFTLPNILQTVSVSCVVAGASGVATSAPSVITITTPVPGSYADQVMSNAPVAFYRFNETGGNTVYDWAGSHDGTYSGAYAKNVAGPTHGEGAVQFWGTNTPTANSQVTVPFAPELMAMTSSNGQFTYECWFKPNVEQPDQCPVSGRFRLGNNLAGIRLYYDNDNDQPEGNGVGGSGSGNNLGFEVQLGRYNNVNQYSRFYAAPTVHQATNVWHHLVATWTTIGTGSPSSGLNGFVTWYVDGVPQTTNSTGFYPLTMSAGGQYAPNRYADLIMGYKEIGNNNPHALPCYGAIGDVAIYTYPLSIQQVQGHYSAYYTPATNQVNPVGVTTNESYANSITLTAVVSGNGNTYQWYLVNGAGSNALSATTMNLDGTPHYPAINNGLFDTQGVDAPVLVISEVTPADDGQYVLVTFNHLNAGGSISTTPATVVVTADTMPPVATAAVGLGQVINGTPAAPGTIQVHFNKRVDSTTSQTIGNYTLTDHNNNVVPISNAYISQSLGDTLFGGDNRVVTLQTTDALTPGETYTLVINSVKDQTYTGNVMAPTTLTFAAPVVVSGLTWDYYAAVPGGMSALTSAQYNNTVFEYGEYATFTQGTNSFPFVPQDETTLASFNTVPLNDGGTPSTGTGLGANPIYGNGTIGSGEGANYGAIISGWITPTRDDNYTFFLRNDDDAALYLSTDNTPGNAYMIAQGTGVNVGFTDTTPGPGAPTSAPITLQANHSYYIEVLFYQAGGNDYASVAWRSATGPDSGTSAANLSPIPGTYLSSYGQPPSTLTTSASGGQVTISWTGYGHLLQSADVNAPLGQWTPVSGSPTSPYTATAGGTQMFYRVAQ